VPAAISLEERNCVASLRRGVLVNTGAECTPSKAATTRLSPEKNGAGQPAPIDSNFPDVISRVQIADPPVNSS
jgi:hypothetical protein